MDKIIFLIWFLGWAFTVNLDSRIDEALDSHSDKQKRIVTIIDIVIWLIGAYLLWPL